MKQFNLVLAYNIRYFRKRKELSQVELARKIGVSPQAVSKWESGKSAPDISLLPMVASTLECQIDELFSSDGMDK